MSDTPGGGYQPRNTPAERRAFFDQDRRINEILAKLAQHDADIAVLEGRVEDLETP